MYKDHEFGIFFKLLRGRVKKQFTELYFIEKHASEVTKRTWLIT